MGGEAADGQRGHQLSWEVGATRGLRMGRGGAVTHATESNEGTALAKYRVIRLVARTPHTREIALGPPDPEDVRLRLASILLQKLSSCLSELSIKSEVPFGGQSLGVHPHYGSQCLE